MQITIKSKQTEVAPRTRAHIERKLQRLSRLVGDEALLEVTVAEEKTRSSKDRYAVHLSCANIRHSNAIHATASGMNVRTALDLVLDKVTAQLGRQKSRHTTAHRLPVSPVKVLALSRSGSVSDREEEASSGNAALNPTDNEEIWSRIMEIRQVATKPMSDQEVIKRMEEENLSFYPFINSETNSVNVMYRLTNGEGYGLLVPAMEQV
jgi:putative sigma-54 modulation protein